MKKRRDAAPVQLNVAAPRQIVCAQPDVVAPHVLDPRLARLLHDWQGWRGNRVLPARSDFRAENLQYLLGHLFLLDIVPGDGDVPGGGSPRFRYRLFGSAVTTYRGFDLTGQFLDQHPDPAFAARAHEAYLQSMRSRLPLWATVSGFTMYGLSANFEGMILPLATDGETPDMMLSAQIMTPADSPA